MFSNKVVVIPVDATGEKREIGESFRLGSYVFIFNPREIQLNDEGEIDIKALKIPAIAMTRDLLIISGGDCKIVSTPIKGKKASQLICNRDSD